MNEQVKPKNTQLTPKNEQVKPKNTQLIQNVAAITPKIRAGATDSNTDSIISCLKNAANAGIKIAILPLNAITGDIGNSTAAQLAHHAINAAIDKIRQQSQICCIFAQQVNAASPLPIIIDSGNVSHSFTHTTKDGTRILIANSFHPFHPFTTNSNDIANSFRPFTTNSNNITNPHIQKEVNVDLIALPQSYPAFMDGTRQATAAAAKLSQISGAVVVSASNGNGNSGCKFVRSADKIIASGGLAAVDSTDCDTLCGINCRLDKPTTQQRQPDWLPTDFQEVHAIISRGIHARMTSAAAQRLVLGLSGGLDSTCALILATITADKYGFNRKNIIAVRMPSRVSTQKTQNNAQLLAQLLGVTSPQIPIDIDYRLSRINHQNHDVVYENAQSRERTAILLDLANKENALVLGTSDLTEIALGFSTYGGDQLAHFNPNSGLTKLAVKKIVQNFALSCTVEQLRNCLLSIVDTPYSPELLPQQSSEQILGPYEVFEFFLLRLLAHHESASQILLGAQKKFPDLKKSQLADYFNTFARRLAGGAFKRKFCCDGIALTPFDLSFFDLNVDLAPQFLL